LCKHLLLQEAFLRLGSSSRIHARINLSTDAERRAPAEGGQLNPPLKELMERGVTPYGMQTFQMAVTKFAKAGVISKETAQRHLGF